VEEKGTHEDDPNVKRAEKYITLPGDDRVPPPGIGDDDTSHMTNWLDCLRSRKPPNATVRHGFAHSVACIMAARACREGRKLYWDARGESIVDRPTGAAAG
jgi:hypothetical protein